MVREQDTEYLRPCFRHLMNILSSLYYIGDFDMAGGNMWKEAQAVLRSLVINPNCMIWKLIWENATIYRLNIPKN